jgi:hypothetical protein
MVLLVVFLSLAGNTALRAQRLSSLSDRGKQRSAPAVAAPLECPLDGYEDNDSFASAYGPISTGIAYCDAYICPSGDVDWFKFSVVTGQEITLDLDSLPADFDLRLYDPSGTLIDSSESGGTAAEQIVHTAGMTGDYRAYVYGYSGAYSEDDDYCLTVTLSEEPTPTHTPTPTPTSTPSCPIDAYEDNDDFFEAYAIEPDISYYGIYICPSGDEDWFKFSVASGDEITADLYNLPEDFDLYLYDPSGTLVGQSNQSGTTAEQIVHTAASTGDYRVGIFGYQGAHSESECTLRVELEAAPTATPTHTPTPTSTPTRTPTATPTATPTQGPGCPETVPDDDFGSANSLTIGTTYTDFICDPEDEDFYSFWVDAGDRITVDLFDLEADYALALYDHAGSPEVALSDDPGATDEQIIYTAVQSGTHYVKVFSQSGEYDVLNPYTLRVTKAAPGPTSTHTPTATPTATPRYPDCPDDFEDNNTCGGPAWALTESGWWSYICASTDEDYWKIPAVGLGQTIEVKLTDLPKNYTLALHRPDCTRAATSSNPGTSDEVIRFAADASGTWYAHVLGDGGAYDITAPYHISGGAFDCSLDALEPNDSSSEPHDLYDTVNNPQTESNLSICPPGDEDWFATSPCTDDLFVIELTHDPAQGPLRMCLVHWDEQTELMCTHYDLSLNRIEYVVPDCGYYYFRVAAAMAGVTNPNYSVAFNVQRSTPTATPTSTPTPTATSRPPVDLVVDGLEVTQGIQDYPNASVPLVADKITWARLYIRSDLRDVCCVTARLRVTGGSPQQTIYLYPVNGPLKARTAASRQAFKDDTLNFLIPPAYRAEGTLVIQPELNYDQAVAESDYGNNNPTYNRTFTARDTLNIVFVRVRYHIKQPGPRPPGTPTLAPTVTPTVLVPPPGTGPRGKHYTRKTFPVPRVQSWLPAAGDTIDFEGDLSTLRGWGELLRKVNWLAAHTKQPPGLFKWYGLVPVLHGALRDGILGLGYTPGQSAIGYVRDTMAHELGHNFNRLHAPCGTSDGLDASFPYAQGKIEAFGFDPDTQQIYDPAKTYDFMSYCNPAWTSPYTFKALYQQIGGPTVIASTGSVEEQDYLLVSGEVDSGAGTGQLGEAYVDARPVGTDDGAGEGPYVLEVRASEGSVLFTRHFDPMVIPLRDDASDADVAATPWLEVLPFPAGARRIVLLHGGIELDAREVSAHAPVVTVVSPNGGETLSGAVDVHWSASDVDGDDLVYTLQYSVDGGETWSAVDVNLSGTQYRMDTEVMAGTTQGKVRVLVSDGINTAADESDDVFSVPSKPPEVYILWPESGQVFEPQEMVLLQGAAYDLEDGPLADEALTWTSDRDGGLGSGEEVPALGLSPGWHDISLTATDSDEGTVNVTVRIFVGPRVYLPVILKNRS